MKKLILISMAALAIAACTSNPKESGINVVENGCNTKISDYLYGVEYDDYDFEVCKAAFDRLQPSAPGCSEVRKGDFVGRNLDWYINREASAVIKVNAKEGRYESIGMVGSNNKFTNDIASSGEWNPVYEILPFTTVDGINEKGLYIGVNVMPTGETSFDVDSWEGGKWGHGAAYTNPESDKTYCVTYLVRIVLDQAGSVDEARELIESINWYEPVNFPHEGDSQAFHWLISDLHKSAVAEFIDNKLYFTETEVVDRPSYATVMTNFTNKLMSDRTLVQNHGMGYERWDTLVENYEAAEESFEGMEDLMKTVWYTKCYTTDFGSHNFMLTDFSNNDFPAYYLYKHYEYWDDEYLLERMNHYKEVFSDKSNWHTDDTGLWYTTHTSVYSISTRTLNVLVHEGLDEQKGFFEASLSSKFVKPLDFKE